MELLIEYGILGLLALMNISLFFVIKHIKNGQAQNIQIFKQNAEWIGDVLDILHGIHGAIVKSSNIRSEFEDKERSEDEMMEAHLKKFDELGKRNK